MAEAVVVSQPTVSPIRQQYFTEGLEATLNRRAPTRIYVRKLDGAQEARLITVAWGTPPEAFDRWTLRLLADKLVELEVVDDVSYQMVRRVLKNDLTPHLTKHWRIPPEHNGEFVWPMEDILEV